MDSKTSAWLITTALGLLIGIADFVSPDFRVVLILMLLGGGVIGFYFSAWRWKLAVWLGLCVPIAIIAGMALRQSPVRGHFVFVDARAVIPAMLGASLAGGLRSRVHRPRWKSGAKSV